MSYYRMSILEETGYAVLDPYGAVIDPSEWMTLEYVDWKSSGDTRFAPLASAQGEIECNAFWHSDPPRTDKDGIWIDCAGIRTGTKLALPPYLTNFMKAPPGMYRMQTTGEEVENPDYVSVWTLNHNQHVGIETPAEFLDAANDSKKSKKRK